ncbi:hypothetical protein H920_00279 [Fukomys damarensis]|uniref:Uncharacterized protein n=1 Tax=Fukomys damarensis TaxID=885580 RepID=A0A091E4Q1_FUKDA|nr:hypothetical protein H920_00279 [Fukomys damarensis]
MVMVTAKIRAPLQRIAAILSNRKDLISSSDDNSQVHIRKTNCSNQQPMILENQQPTIFPSRSLFMPLATILRSSPYQNQEATSRAPLLPPHPQSPHTLRSARHLRDHAVHPHPTVPTVTLTTTATSVSHHQHPIVTTTTASVPSAPTLTSATLPHNHNPVAIIVIIITPPTATTIISVPAPLLENVAARQPPEEARALRAPRCGFRFVCTHSASGIPLYVDWHRHITTPPKLGAL